MEEIIKKLEDEHVRNIAKEVIKELKEKYGNSPVKHRFFTVESLLAEANTDDGREEMYVIYSSADTSLKEVFNEFFRELERRISGEVPSPAQEEEITSELPVIEDEEEELSSEEDLPPADLGDTLHDDEVVSEAGPISEVELIQKINQLESEKEALAKEVARLKQELEEKTKKIEKMRIERDRAITDLETLKAKSNSYSKEITDLKEMVALGVASAKRKKLNSLFEVFMALKSLRGVASIAELQKQLGWSRYKVASNLAINKEYIIDLQKLGLVKKRDYGTYALTDEAYEVNSDKEAKRLILSRMIDFMLKEK